MSLWNLFGIFGRKAQRYTVLTALIAATASGCKAKIEPLYQEQERKAEIARQAEAEAAKLFKEFKEQEAKKNMILAENKEIRDKREKEKADQAVAAAAEDAKKAADDAKARAEKDKNAANDAADKAAAAGRINADMQTIAETIQSSIEEIARIPKDALTQKRQKAQALRPSLKEFSKKLKELESFGVPTLEADLIRGFDGLQKYYDYYDYLATYDYAAFAKSPQPILPAKTDHPFRIKLLEEQITNLERTEKLLGIHLRFERSELKELIRSFVTAHAATILIALKGDSVRVDKGGSIKTLQIFQDKAADLADDL